MTNDVHITVIDSIMGSGKTTKLINMINEADEDQRFLVVTPLLTEVDRFQKEVTKTELFAPNVEKFGTKYTHLLELIRENKNIVTTHALFGAANAKLYSLLQESNYTLILDESFDVINQFDNIYKEDIEVLKKQGWIEIKDKGVVNWTSEKGENSRYSDIKFTALGGNLRIYNESALFWVFNPRIFSSFKYIYILTFMFDGQIIKPYLDLHDFNFEIKSIQDFKLVDISKYYIDKAYWSKLINIYHGKYNKPFSNEYDLSKNWFEKRAKKSQVERLRKNIYSFFRTKCKTVEEFAMWTTYKDQFSKLKNRGFQSDEDKRKNGRIIPRSFTECNLRATNLYRKKKHLAYCVNLYYNPIVKNFFTEHDIDFNQDKFSLSNMLQWIFRSAVRDGKPIEIYIPSKRMRDLLLDWIQA
jgi:hypothetical protein